MTPVLWLVTLGIGWILALVTAWLGYIAWLRWRHQQRLERREPYRAAALLGAFGGDDAEEATRELSDARAAFDEEVARIRSRANRQYARREE